MLVPTILFYVIISQTSVCDAIAKSNPIWSKFDHVSTIETDISSIRCSSHEHLMNSVKLTFKFLSMKSNHIKFYLSGCIKILVLNTSSSWLLGNLSIPAVRVYFRHFSWISEHFSWISPFISDNGCETHLSGKIITMMTAQETSLSPGSLESHLLKWWGYNRVFISCDPCSTSLVGLMDWLRSLTTISPDWWPFSLSFIASFLCLYDLWLSL
jgi:hypothetical protein